MIKWKHEHEGEKNIKEWNLWRNNRSKVKRDRKKERKKERKNVKQTDKKKGFYFSLFYSRLCPSTAGSNPPPEFSVFASFAIQERKKERKKRRKKEKSEEKGGKS